MGEGGVGLSPARRGSAAVLNPICFTRFEFADALRVSVRTVDRMIAAGEIRVRRVRGKAVRILRSDAERYLNRKAETLKS
jgi:excisionase family DNA binding protein